MNWYYADQGRQKGPVGEAELDELVSSGALASSALIWSEGMTDWKPYSATRVERAATSPSDDPLMIALRPGACVCCGRFIPPQQSVTVGRNAVCPDCKPVYVERLREADLVTLPGSLPYAGFWIRFVARMADYTLLSLIQVTFTGSAVVWASRNSGDASAAFAAFGITTLLGLAVSCFYETALVGTRGATVGKMLCYLRVVHPDGSPVAVPTALGRYFAELLSRLTAFIGYIMVAFDVEKRALHDRIASTRVIDVPPNARQRSELEPVSRQIRCERCHADVPSTEWNWLEPLPCPGCGTPVQAIVFPALARSLVFGAVQPKEGEGEAGCYYHDANRATITCEECGRFLCPLCDFDGGARHVCPNCFNGHVNSGDLPESVQRRTQFDTIAMTAALLPNVIFFLMYFTAFTAPAVIGFSIWSWNKAGSILPRTRWRFVVAIIAASLSLVFVGIIMLTAVMSMFK